MKRLLLVVLVACAPPPAKSGESAEPLPSQTVSAPGGGQDAPHESMRLVVQGQAGDRDGDGIRDDVDKCPDDPEDFDGFEDEDGCPDPDNDRDGILDMNDKCPNIPGPPPDGCPKRP